MRRSVLVVAVLLGLMAVSVAIGAPIYTLTPLSRPGDKWSYAHDVNDHGHVVGYVCNAEGQERAFRWQDGAMYELGTLGGSVSYAYGINNMGQIVGRSQDGSPQRANLPFVWENGVMQSLANIGDGTAFGINDSGQVVGRTGYKGFLWQDGTVRYLSDGSADCGARGINGSGSVVGYGSHNALLWNNGVPTDLGGLPGSTGGAAYSINSIGQAVGGSLVGHCSHAVLWSNGQRLDLGFLPGGSDSFAESINDRCEIVGSTRSAHKGMRAFLWESGVMYDLNDRLDESGTGWYLIDAYAINNRGQIVGRALNPYGGGEAFLLTPIPEPSSLLALLCGCGGVAWCRARWRAS